MRVYRVTDYKFCIPAKAIMLSALLAFLFLPSTAKAFDETQFTEAEKVGFAFHQLADFEPDFEKWILNSDRYNDASPVSKVQMMQKDVYRLRNGYYNYLPDQNLVTLELKGRLEMSNFYQQSQKEGATTKVRMFFEEMPNSYLPFNIGEMWIAVIIKDFDLQQEIAFTPEEFKDFAEKFKIRHTAYQMIDNIGIDLKLRPVSVDASTPVHLDEMDMWLMMAETAELRLWRKKHQNADKEYFYDYQAPWYVSEDHRELLRLYRQ